MTERTLSFVVVGNAKTQGSKTMRQMPNGTTIMFEAVKGLKDWRTMVTQIAWATARTQNWERIPKDSAVSVTLAFEFTKPKRGAAEYPRKRDIDKLTRAIFDSITRAQNIWHDDDQVALMTVRKNFCRGDSPEGVRVWLSWHPRGAQ